MPGLARDDAQPIAGDHLCARAAWSSGSDLDSVRSRTIRLKVYVEHGDLYSLSIVDDAAPGGD